MTVITYKKPSNPHISRYQNSVRGISTRIFANLEEAREFAKKVEVVNIFDRTGKKVDL